VGVMVEDLASLLDAGSKLLRQGSFLIKDDYGVSGKGNQLIETDRALHALQVSVRTNLSREASEVFLEPYLPKSSDFSCQFRIEEDGRATVFCVQELINKGLAFGASWFCAASFLEKLYRDGYFQVNREDRRAPIQGWFYWGDVCIDSMVLQSGELCRWWRSTPASR